MGEKPPLLHELLKEDQEPFHLKTYIANKQSQLKTSTTTLSLRKRRPIFHDAPTKRTNCFLSFTASPDVRRSPFLDLPSPVKSPPNAAVFLHIPSRTATILVEAAMRIQKHQHSKPRTGFGLLGSFLKRLKDRSKNRKRAIGDKVEVMACSCSNRSADWAEDKSPPSTSSRVMEDICISDEDCTTPFRFSLHQSPSSTTPEFCSPAASPSRRLKQEKENSDNVQGDEEEEEKEQCSPVSVLDAPFDEDDERESGGADDEEDYDMECSYENVQRAKQQLLHRLRRFEKLAELDPVELEKKLMVEGSDNEGHVERGESEGDGPLSADMKRLVSDLIVEEKKRLVQSGGSEVVMGRICNRLDSWKEVEFDTIDMMIGLDFKKEVDRWSKHGQQVQETAAEIEVAIYLLLIQELTDELLI